MTDDRLEQIVGKLLRAGVVLSGAVVAAGGIWYLAESGSHIPHYAKFSGQPQTLRSLGRLPLPQAIIEIGLLLLIATPVARVAFALVAFALERDRIYVVVTLFVLLILLYSIGTSWL